MSQAAHLERQPGVDRNLDKVRLGFVHASCKDSHLSFNAVDKESTSFYKLWFDLTRQSVSA